MEFINWIQKNIYYLYEYLFNITKDDAIIEKNIKETAQTNSKLITNRNLTTTIPQTSLVSTTIKSRERIPIHKVYIQLSQREKSKKFNLSIENFDKYINNLPYEPDRIECQILKARQMELDEYLLLNASFKNIINIKINLLCYLFNLNDERPYYSHFITSSNPDNIIYDKSFENITANMNDNLKQLYSETYDPRLVRLKNNSSLDYYIDNRHLYQIIDRKGFEKARRPSESLFLYECFTMVYSKIIRNIENFEYFRDFYGKNIRSLNNLIIPKCYIPFLTENNKLFNEYKKTNRNYILPETRLFCLNQIYYIEYHIIWIIYINIKIRNIIEKNIEKNIEVKDDYDKVALYISGEYNRLLEQEKKKHNINKDFGYQADQLELYKDYIHNNDEEINNNSWINHCLYQCNFSYELFVNYILKQRKMDKIDHLSNEQIHNEINEIYLDIERIKDNITDFDTKITSIIYESETKKIIRNYIKKIIKSKLIGGKKKNTYKKKKQKRKSNKKLKRKLI